METARGPVEGILHHRIEVNSIYRLYMIRIMIRRRYRVEFQYFNAALINDGVQMIERDFERDPVEFRTLERSRRPPFACATTTVAFAHEPAASAEACW